MHVKCKSHFISALRFSCSREEKVITSPQKPQDKGGWISPS